MVRAVPDVVEMLVVARVVPDVVEMLAVAPVVPVAVEMLDVVLAALDAAAMPVGVRVVPGEVRAVAMLVVARVDQARNADVARAVGTLVAAPVDLPNKAAPIADTGTIADAAKEMTNGAGMAVATPVVTAKAKVARPQNVAPRPAEAVTEKVARHSSPPAVEVDGPPSDHRNARHSADVPPLVADLRSDAESPRSAAASPSGFAPRSVARQKVARVSVEAVHLAKRSRRRCVRDLPR